MEAGTRGTQSNTDHVNKPHVNKQCFMAQLAADAAVVAHRSEKVERRVHADTVEGWREFKAKLVTLASQVWPARG